MWFRCRHLFWVSGLLPLLLSAVAISPVAVGLRYQIAFRGHTSPAVESQGPGAALGYVAWDSLSPQPYTCWVPRAVTPPLTRGRVLADREPTFPPDSPWLMEGLKNPH